MQYLKIKNIVFILILFYGSAILFPQQVIKDLFCGQGPLVLDKQGNMYIGYDSHSIVKYSPQGKELLKMGQDGAGPGDIRRMNWYAFNPKDNNIYVTEYFEGNRWISRFTTEGKFAGVWNFELGVTKYDASPVIEFDSQGNVIVVVLKKVFKRYRDFDISENKYELLKFSPEGKFIVKIYSFSLESAAYKEGNFTATIPFNNGMEWTVFQEKIIVKETGGDFIAIFSPDGKLEKQIPFPAKKEKVTNKDLDDWEKEVNSWQWIKSLVAQGRANVGFWKRNLPFPAYKPNTEGRMCIDSKGYLYLREYTGYDRRDSIQFKINLQNGEISKFKLKPGLNIEMTWNNQFILYTMNDDEETLDLIFIDEKDFESMVDPKWK